MRGAVWVLVASVLAGCAGASGPAGSSSAADELAGTTAASIACVEGRVVDDELRPIANATVFVVSTRQTLRSMEDGRFRVCGLASGTYTLNVEAFGYQIRAVNFETVDGSGSVEVRLAPIVSRVPRAVVLPFTIYYQWGLSAMDSTTSRYGANLTTCGPCTFAFSTPTLPFMIFFEAHWKRNPAPPGGQPDEMYHAFRGGKPFAQGEEIGSGLGGQPFSFDYVQSEMKVAAAVKDAKVDVPFSGAIYCGGLAPCSDQRIHVLMSTLYDYDEAPEEYTALP